MIEMAQMIAAHASKYCKIRGWVVGDFKKL
jgi:hypothetical protein